MLGSPTNTLISDFMTYMSNNNMYVSLHSGTPSMFTPSSNEIGTRQKVTWTIGTNAVSNSADLIFTGLSTTNISYVCIFDALTAGNVLFMIPLSSPYSLVASGSTGIYTIPASTIFIDFEQNTTDYVVDGGTPYTVWTTPSTSIGDGGTP